MERFLALHIFASTMCILLIWRSKKEFWDLGLTMVMVSIPILNWIALIYMTPDWIRDVLSDFHRESPKESYYSD